MRRAGSPEGAAYINDGCSPSEKNIIIGYIVIGHIVIGLHPMVGYSALSGLCGNELSQFR
jgi:hypothetical protein